MRIGNFLASIPEGREHGTGHVSLEHGQTYTLRLMNCWHDRDCDADVTIDGKSIGGFRLSRGETLILERSPDDRGRFTFFKADSNEGQMAGAAAVAVAERGLITVRFRAGFPIYARPPFTPIAWPKARRGERVWPVVPRPEPVWHNSDSTVYGTSVTPQCSTRGVEQEVKTCGGLSLTSMEAGVTGLTGHSDQDFRSVDNLNYDPSVEVIINLRLVISTVGSVRPLRAVDSNPVPVAV